MQEHSIVIKIILTGIVLADMVKNYSRKEMRVLQGLALLHPNRTIYTVYK